MNKKLLCSVAILVLLSVVSRSQTNTFPTNGNVGIGTTNPLTALDVRNGNILVKNLANQTNESVVMIDHSLGFGSYQNFGTSLRTFTENDGYNIYALQFFTQNSYLTGQTEKLRISGNGNVGIGTTTPNQRLSVSGNISASVSSNEGAALILENPSKNANNLAYRWALYNMTGVYGNSLQFWNYSQDNSISGPKMAITDNGNVLIGKTTQTNTSYKLDINGRIRANEIVVNTNGADFVFEDNYKLRPLKAVEVFVKQNKHLPEIPTAKTMQAEGIGISELQTKLLQKIEELTLYVIQQQKEIEELKKKINN